jgi:hypothetical protein
MLCFGEKRIMRPERMLEGRSEHCVVSSRLQLEIKTPQSMSSRDMTKSRPRRE